MKPEEIATKPRKERGLTGSEKTILGLNNHIGDLMKTIGQVSGDLQQANNFRATLEKRFAEAQTEIADLRDKLMAATIQNERMGGYLDALADAAPAPELVPDGPQYRERMLRRDQFGPLARGVSEYASDGRRAQGTDTYYASGQAANWWNRRS